MRRDISTELAVTTELDGSGLIAIIDLRNDNFVLLDINESKALRDIIDEYITRNERVN
jgi:hypothetical protein